VNQVRPAAVAGMFYPRDARALERELADLLDGVEHLAPRFGHPKALVVPHAGYLYSGPVAARAYDELGAARGIVKRVVLLGPVHRVPVRGLALPGVAAFETPLGRVPVDAEGVRLLAPFRQVVASPEAHAPEHSLEVQLPFLQKMLGGFALVPLAVGDARAQEVREVVERLWGGPETLFVISTDLSHYHAYEKARAIDHATLARIAAFDTDINHEEACGATPLNGFLAAARARGLSIRLLGRATPATPRAAGSASWATPRSRCTRAAAPRSRTRARRCSASRTARSATRSARTASGRAPTPRRGSRAPGRASSPCSSRGAFAAASTPGAGGMRCPTAASSATSARATAAARRPARAVLRAQAEGGRDGADHLRPLLGLLHRSDREEAAEPLLPRHAGAFLRHRRLQPRLQVLPELGHLQVARDGPAAWTRPRPRKSPWRPQAAAAAASPSPTTTR
jgi:MEMO1 family protein